MGGSISERIKREVRRVGQEQSEIKGIWRTGRVDVGRKYIDRPNEIRSRLSSALYGVICPIFRTRSLSLFFQKAKTRTDKYIYRPDVLRERVERETIFFLFFYFGQEEKDSITRRRGV